MVPWEVLTILSKPGLGPQKLFRLSCLYHLAIFPLSKPSLTTTRVHSPQKKNAKNAPALQASLVVLKPSAPSTRGWRPPLWLFSDILFRYSKYTDLRVSQLVSGRPWSLADGGQRCEAMFVKKTSGFKLSQSKNLYRKMLSWGVSSDFNKRCLRQNLPTIDGDRQPSRSKMAHWRQGTVRAYDVLVLHVLDNFSILAMTKQILSTVITIIC